VSTALPLVYRSIVAVTVQTEAANGKPPTVKAVAHNNLGHQQFMPKHLLKTAVGIVFLKRNEDLHQPMCWLQVLKFPFHVKDASSISCTWLRKAGVSVHRTLFNAHNTAVVVELEHAVHGMNITVDHATPSAQFAGKWSDDRPIAWY
jgi:hypothetical protein